MPMSFWSWRDIPSQGKFSTSLSGEGLVPDIGPKADGFLICIYFSIYERWYVISFKLTAKIERLISQGRKGSIDI